MKCDNANVGIFWLNDGPLTDGNDLPEPDVLAQDIVEDLEDALAQFVKLATELGERRG